MAYNKCVPRTNKKRESEISKSVETYIADYMDYMFFYTDKDNGKKYVFDMRTLSKKICMDSCMYCGYSNHDDCCGDSPHPATDEYWDMFFGDGILEKSLACMPDDHREGVEAFAKRYGYLLLDDNGYEGMFDPSKCEKTFTAMEHGCIMMFVDGVWQRCAIHAAALDEGVNPAAWKPPACTLYPIDIVVRDDESEFVFIIDEETIDFSIWGEHDLKTICVDEKNSKTRKKGAAPLFDLNIPRKAFKNYIEAYYAQREVMDYFFGKKATNALIKHAEENVK